MAKGHKPVAGSRAFWPRKRAKRIYASYSTKASEGILAFAGYKAGMTQVSYVDNRKGSPTQGKEIFSAATVLAAPNMVVAGIKAYKKTYDGLKDSGTLWTESLEKDLARKMSLPKKRQKKELEGDEFRLIVHTKPREVGKKTPEVFEVPVQNLEIAKEKLGKELKAGDIFKEGEFIDVRSVSKGKGVQGPVKRFGVIIRSRKAQKKRRHIGVMAPRGVARVLPGAIAMAGQHGFQTRTEFNKLILKIGDDGLTPSGGWLHFGELKGSYIIVKGSVPGPKKRLIMLRKGLRSTGENKTELNHIIKTSQQ